MFKNLAVFLILLANSVALAAPSTSPSVSGSTNVSASGSDSSSSSSSAAASGSEQIPAGPAQATSMTITNEFARPSLASNNNSAVYMSIKNDSDKDQTLINASALSVANNVEMHQTIVDDKGITKMVPLDKIVIPAKSKVDLAPGGMHIMLINLKSPLKTGDKFKVTLYFQNGTAKTIEVEVKSN